MTQPHGIPGQMNIYVLDRDSDITGYGTHNRLTVFGDGGLIEVREDLIGLPAATEAHRQRVLRGWQRLHPRGTRLTHTDSHTTDRSVWHTYTVTRPLNRGAR